MVSAFSDFGILIFGLPYQVQLDLTIYERSNIIRPNFEKAESKKRKFKNTENLLSQNYGQKMSAGEPGYFIRKYFW